MFCVTLTTDSLTTTSIYFCCCMGVPSLLELVLFQLARESPISVVFHGNLHSIEEFQWCNSYSRRKRWLTVKETTFGMLCKQQIWWILLHNTSLFCDVMPIGSPQCLFVYYCYTGTQRTSFTIALHLFEHVPCLVIPEFITRLFFFIVPSSIANTPTTVCHCRDGFLTIVPPHKVVPWIYLQ